MLGMSKHLFLTQKLTSIMTLNIYFNNTKIDLEFRHTQICKF